MGVTVQVWRMRIGGFNAQGACDNTLTFILPMSTLLSSLHLYLLLFALLLIGNIEINPGPMQLTACSLCNFKAVTAEQHIHHQQIHSSNFNFKFSCPFSGCHHSYSTFRSVSSHISEHSVPRNEVINEAIGFKCDHCNSIIFSNRDYCLHIKKNHLNTEDGERIQCPLFLGSDSKCNSTLTTSAAFGVHLSRYHPGWRQDYSNSALARGSLQETPGYSLPDTECGNYFEETEGMIDDEGNEHPNNAVNFNVSDDSDAQSDASSSSGQWSDGVFEYDQIVDYIAHFYAMLEGKYIVPTSTVNALASKLSFISEVLQDKIKKDLLSALTSVGLDSKVVSRIVQSVVTMDPLYNSHHINAPGECFLTFARRKTYYKKYFKYQAPIPINLRTDPQNMEDTIQYVDVKETLLTLLEDPSVQKAVDDSFKTTASDGSVLQNYTDGSVFRESQTPQKRIDVFLYMDAYNCANPLGSAKNKHKMTGMYMNLGNLKPFMRSYLRSMRLVLLFNEKSMKKSESRFKKCFKKLIKTLKDLEENGILYKGEKVAFRVQFVQGDNLGQHTIGGFIESFSGSHFCRFCDLPREMFREGFHQDKPQFPLGAWRTPESFQRDLQTKVNSGVDHQAGVKRDSPFHQLKHFHVCGPRLAPCIGHDLFIGGVVDCDLASIIKGMIGRGWFTEHQLNMRIKHYKYFGNDARNKPAEFKQDKKMLGGHAIQNWTLCRLLPLLIGDLVQTDHKLWKLYLLLKSIIELVCAPSLTTDQVELMRRLIKKYMKKRKVLPNNYKPKHHFFSHYPDLFLKFGPLVHMWSMAFEHRHQFFKRVSNICRNFINLGKLLASKFQLLQAYESRGLLFPNNPVFSETSNLSDQNCEQNLADYLSSLNLPKETVAVKGLSLNDIKHKEGESLLLSSNSGNIFVGEVKIIIYDGDVCKAVIEKHKAEQWEDYGLYYISETCPGFSVVSFQELENPCPQPIYKFCGYSCFSLKHVFQG